MEQSKKFLKIYSILILAFAVVDLITAVLDLVLTDFSGVQIPEGAPGNTLLIAKTILFVFAALVALPQLYVGFKGLKVIKTPGTSKAHIVWATILFVILAVGVILSAVSIFKGDDVAVNAVGTGVSVVEMFCYYFYIKYAKEIANAA